MKFIAHRGLINGKKHGQIENHPAQISFALTLGYDAEIDAFFEDGKWLLGHDRPIYEVPYQFMLQKGLWIHCKNLNALHELSKRQIDSTYPNFFWHQEDDYTLTSHGYIWTHVDCQRTTDKSILIMDVENPEEYWFTANHLKSSYGVCSTWIETMKKELS